MKTPPRDLPPLGRPEPASEAADETSPTLPGLPLVKADDFRRLRGYQLEAMGLGPVESPYRIVHRMLGVRVRQYGTGAETGPAVLIVPAPIKRPYIWDLSPEVSVVRRCVESGARVFMLDWQPGQRGLGLADYADRMIRLPLRAIGVERPVLLGHSLGGLFAALHAAQRPSGIAGLGLVGAPLDFSGDTGVFAALRQPLALDALPDPVPGSLLTAGTVLSDPQTFVVDRWFDLMRSAPDPLALRTHMRVIRWTLDEFSLPRRLVAELAQTVIRPNSFVRGTLVLEGRSVRPESVVAPLLAVVDEACTVAPPSTILPFHEAARSTDKTLVPYRGDVGVALRHVGPLVGREAHARTWPQIVEWIHRVGT